MTLNAELQSHRSSHNVWKELRRRAIARRVVAGSIGAGLMMLGRRRGMLARLAGLAGSALLLRAVAGADDLAALAARWPVAAGHSRPAIDEALKATFPASDAVATSQP